MSELSLDYIFKETGCKNCQNYHMSREQLGFSFLCKAHDVADLVL